MCLACCRHLAGRIDAHDPRTKTGNLAALTPRPCQRDAGSTLNPYPHRMGRGCPPGRVRVFVRTNFKYLWLELIAVIVSSQENNDHEKLTSNNTGVNHRFLVGRTPNLCVIQAKSCELFFL